MINALSRWFDDRLGASRFARTTLNKIFPDHWSFLLGEFALYSFVIIVLTGVFLTFFFEASTEEVIYEGSYAPLRGEAMSAAFRSTLDLSFDVRAGLVMRQIHHWAALVFLAAIIAHLCRVFFTGAFRRPRELNWMVGVTLLLLAVLNGFTGYSLPDDLLSGTGLRIFYSIFLAVPVIGTWVAFLLFGGEFPAHDIIGRLFVMHVLLVPAAIVGLIVVHMGIMWRQKHTHFPGPGRTEGNVSGIRLWPTYVVKTSGVFVLVTAVLAGMGGLIQINPVWLYGPFEAADVTTAAQPDWYIGWLEGALRLFPPWDFTLFGYTVSEVLIPGIVLPSITFVLLYAWPFLERRLTGEREEHHVLDRPRDRPVRTAIGVGVLTFYGVLLLAGGDDIIAQKLDVAIVPVVWAFRILLFVLPLVAAVFAWKLCRDLAADDPLTETEAEAETETEGEAGEGAAGGRRTAGAVAEGSD
ncbi:MAG: ubiquinol-cytochrome c reductase cytochrome b subunit [Actinomycetota bacterium]|nr:ubiquinol-cytochrome c reductase cytochrome b subunit [Actinomycetota bacterium]